MQKQVYLDTTFKVKTKIKFPSDQNKIDARTFQCQGCGGNNNSESVRSWNVYWTSWNSTKLLQKYFVHFLFYFQQKQLTLVRPSARVYSGNSLSLESKSSRPLQIQSWNQSPDSITESTYRRKIFTPEKKSDKKCFFRLRELLAAQRSEAAARYWWPSSTSRFVHWLEQTKNSVLFLVLKQDEVF